MLTSARGRDILLFVRGRVVAESETGDLRPSAKRKAFSFSAVAYLAALRVHGVSGDGLAFPRPGRVAMICESEECRRSAKFAAEARRSAAGAARASLKLAGAEPARRFSIGRPFSGRHGG